MFCTPLPSLKHSLRVWKAANGTEPCLQVEGETWGEGQTRLKIELTLVHVGVSGASSGLQMSESVHLPFQQNIISNSIHRTLGPAGICRGKASRF